MRLGERLRPVECLAHQDVYVEPDFGSVNTGAYVKPPVLIRELLEQVPVTFDLTVA
jgi:hypothetical protein